MHGAKINSDPIFAYTHINFREVRGTQEEQEMTKTKDID
jgi:hypothetical protein